MSTTADERRTTVRAQARFVRSAPRKAQLVVDQIRGRSVPEARTILAFLTRAAAKDVEKVLSSAVANAEANHGLIGDDLYIAEAYVGGGPMLKRYRARARGRVARIRKRTCHITIVLATPPDYEFVELPEAPPAVAETLEDETPEAEETPEALADEEVEARADEADEETAEEEAGQPEAAAEPPSVEDAEAQTAPAPEAPEPEPVAEAEPAAETTVEEPEPADAAPPADESATEPDDADKPAGDEAPKPRRQSNSRKKATSEEATGEAEDKPARKRRTRKKADETDEEGKEG